MVSIVVYMDAPPNSIGAFTRDVPGLAVRMTVMDEIIEDGLDIFYEILGGTTDARDLIIQGMKDQYQATVKVNQDRPDAWRANVCFMDLSTMRKNAFFSALIESRYEHERLVLVYEDGMAIYRLDLPHGASVEDARPMVDRFREAAQRVDANAVVRIGDLARELEDWRPMAEYEPTR